jgi:hypothetical protein
MMEMARKVLENCWSHSIGGFAVGVSVCEHGPKKACGRKIAVSGVAGGVCISHYRMWRAGKPLETPVRGYQRYTEGPDGTCKAVAARPVLPRPEKFAKELALLKELGLR